MIAAKVAMVDGMTTFSFISYSNIMASFMLLQFLFVFPFTGYLLQILFLFIEDVLQKLTFLAIFE